jgi:hypothetical protein
MRDRGFLSPATKFGSFAMLSTILRASSLPSNFAACVCFFVPFKRLLAL